LRKCENGPSSNRRLVGTASENSSQSSLITDRSQSSDSRLTNEWIIVGSSQFDQSTDDSFASFNSCIVNITGS
jgi:hypothetical protein